MTCADNRRGIIDMSIGMALFIGNDALAKLVSESLPGPQLIFIRGLFACLLMVVVCRALGVFQRNTTTAELPVRQLLNGRLLIRASLDAIGTMVYLTALFRIPLGNATAINMATPLFITLMAIVAFKEQVDLARWLAIGAGFGGVLLIVQPAAAGFNAWALLCLGGTVLLSVRDLMTRVIPSRIPSLLITLSTVLAITLLAGIITAFQGWQSVSLRQLCLLAGAGVLLSGGFFQLVRALRVSEMSVVTPFRYTGLLYALLLGWLMWGDVPNTTALVGIALLAAAGVFMLTQSRAKTQVESLNTAND
jgi:drug/metabolite transporter (DMT)-like permease